MHSAIFDACIVSKQLSERTVKLLNNLSSRISSRKEYSKVEYIVTISENANYQIVVFEPSVEIYPSRHQRSQLDKVNLLQYTLSRKFSDFVIVDINSLKLVVRQNTFANGTYQYKLSTSKNNKQVRHWYKIN